MSFLEDIMGTVEESVEALNKKFPGVVTGKVRSVLDPLSLGRIQVQLPFIDSLDMSPWARVAVPMAGMYYGHYFMPNVDDEVLVAFEHGDVKAPYIIGYLWTATSPPPLASPLPGIRALRSQGGNQIVFTETPTSITIQTGPTPTQSLPAQVSPTGPHNSLALGSSGVSIATPTQVEIAVQTTKVTITPSAVTITLGSNSIAMSTSGVQINGANITINATGPLTLKGNPVLIN